MDRRHLLRLGASSAVLVVLAGCATIPQVVNDANIIADGVSAILPTVKALTGLGGGAYQTVVNAVNAIKSAASTLATATGGAAATAANAIPVALSTISAAIANFHVPSWVTTVLAAAQTIAPIVIQAVGVLPLGRLAAEGGSGMTPAQARAILIAATAK